MVHLMLFPPAFVIERLEVCLFHPRALLLLVEICGGLFVLGSASLSLSSGVCRLTYTYLNPPSGSGWLVLHLR